MTRAVNESRTSRLEHFIKLAREGKKVTIEIELHKQLVKQRIYPDETDTMEVEIDMYLLTGDYRCSSPADTPTISKIYMFAALDESVTDAQSGPPVPSQMASLI